MAKQESIELHIERIAGLGDGVGVYQDKPVFVPHTTSGDLVRAKVINENNKLIKAELLEVLEPGPGRIEPACQHFRTCGGCSMQHLNQEEYSNFKKELLRQAVARAGFDADFVDDPVLIGSRNRRRAELKAFIDEEGVVLGFYIAKTHQVVDITMCPVITPSLEALIGPLRQVLASCLKPVKAMTVRITQASDGIELVINAEKRPSYKTVAFLKEFAGEQAVNRIVWKWPNGIRTIHESTILHIHCGETAVEMPVDSFIQATEAGQENITKIIVEATAEATKIADLFAGCGTWSFPLVQAGHLVSAYEGAPSMIEAMHQAITNHDLDGKIQANLRDLYENPVSGVELLGFDAVVVNPPRNGAEPQIAAIAESRVPLVIVVSCNQRTLERDAKHLAENEYSLIRSCPVDQFHWTGHLESVSIFSLSSQ